MSGMSTAEVSSVKSFLKQQGINTSSEWIEACIEFLKQEHGVNIALSTLRNQVYQQWLDADLEEIGVSCLPPECSTAQKMTLNGCFTLQVQGIRDIGKSAYSQLKEIEKTENSNAEFSAAPAADVPAWESKPTRMLLIQMTDGCSCIQGMEYKPLSSFSPNLPPGVKVLIQGPVDCRFGIMLLSSETIKVLGGEVESKLMQFSRKTILRQILQLPDSENNNPSMTEDNQININSHPNSTTTNPVQQRSSSPNQFSGSSSNRFTDSSSNQVSGSSSNRLTESSSHQVSGSSSNRFTESSNNQVSGSTTLNQFSRSSSNQLTRSSVFSSTSVGSAGSSRLTDDAGLVFDDGDDDFERSLDCDALDVIEQECIRQSQSRSVGTNEEDENVWNEDEDMVNDLMNFQDDNDGFELPTFPETEDMLDVQTTKVVDFNKPFNYLSAALKDPLKRGVVTIKAFIIAVLSKLECKKEQGWCLAVKVNDGTATLDVNIHDTVLENIIGIPATTMLKMQVQAAKDPEKRREVTQALAKCKTALQDYNCLMDIEFQPGEKPCLVKCYPVSQLTSKQLLERVKATS